MMTEQELEAAMSRFAIAPPERGRTRRWSGSVVGGSSWRVELHAMWPARQAHPSYVVSVVSEVGVVRPLLHTDALAEAVPLFLGLARDVVVFK